MNFKKSLALIIAVLISFSAFAGCADTQNPEDTTSSDSVNDSTDNGKSDLPYVRPEETYEGVGGIVLRTDIVPEGNVFDGTQVTDIILPADCADQVAAILGENKVNVWLSVDITNPNDSALSDIEAAMSADGVFGIELNMCDIEPITENIYEDLEIINEFMSKVNEKVRANGNIRVAARVYYDITTNYDCGLDVPTWVFNGYLDALIPSSGSDFSNTDIPVRIWSALVDPAGVTLIPNITQKLSTNDEDTAFDQTNETLIGEAANYISQGADKICIGDWIDDELLTVIGSYETVMAENRVHVLTYSNAQSEWVKDTVQLPKTIASGYMNTFRIQLGNVPEGAKVTLKLAVTEIPENMPVVFVNSKECDYIGIDPENENIICFKVPANAHNEGYVVAEIRAIMSRITIEDIFVCVDVK